MSQQRSFNRLQDQNRNQQGQYRANGGQQSQLVPGQSQYCNNDKQNTQEQGAPKQRQGSTVGTQPGHKK
ncbi:hypothetical protein [Planctomicrobium piriforme]|uniref:Uncharacterized protein n=1 Tax=Planctomicrobium piriforme TaxID=1576369 RepID=A0A1I3RDA7_9PLAN|nr:hypothetical protein [Planctomicrobium piriforme]SFJ43812.1 hypothetical protein SAMN05421753_12082 [Planctomicrobium piriforme]